MAMSIAASISPMGQTQTRYGKQAIAVGAGTAFVVHWLAAIAIFTIAATPPAIPSAPIMVSMINAPTPEPVRPEPEVQPKPRPVTKQPLPAPKTLLVAEKPAAEPAQTAPTPQPPPGAVAAEPAPAPVVIPPRFDAAYLDNPSPPYPPMSRRLGEQGKVLLRVLVNTDGSAAQVELKNSSGSSRLDQSALDTVKRWRFVPAKLGSQAVTAWVLVPISFTLGA
jgi:protein TonB